MHKTHANATVLMSGGIDSAACAHLFKSQGLSVEGLFIDYGQSALAAESRSVRQIADHLSISLKFSQIAGSAPLGPGELVGRNALLISTALFITRGAPGLIGIGIHAGTPYFDCSEMFVDRMNRLVSEQTDGKVSISAPFITWTKADICTYFRSSALPFTLTYSCESGSDPPCGTCASCKDRRAIGC